MHNIESKQIVKLGIITFIMLIAIGALLIWKSGIFLRASGYELIGEFKGIAGLLNGAQVRYRGYEVGKVSRIIPGPVTIKVHFWIYSNIKVPVDAKLRVVFDGLIGERYIGIAPLPTSSKEMCKPGAVLSGYATSGLADFVDVGTQSLEQTRLILSAIRTIIAEKDVLNSVKNSVLEFEQIAKGLNNVVKELQNVSGAGQIRDIMNSLKAVSQTLQKTTDAILDDGNLGNTVNQSAVNLATISKSLKRIVVNLEDSLGNTMVNVETITSEIKNMLKDSELKNGVKSTITNSQEIIQKSGKFVSTIASIEVDYNIGLNHYGTQKKTAYRLLADFGIGNRFLRIGTGDLYDTNNAYDLQVGTWILDNVALRGGFFYNYPGIGMDFHPIQSLQLASEIYNFNQMELDLMGSLIMWRGVGLNVGMKDIFDTADQSWILGLTIQSQ